MCVKRQDPEVYRCRWLAMSLDPATASAIAAVLVASVALVVALAQAVQQYLVTGQLIRTCDSVVFGRLPGQGRRIWQFSQFRFRIVYCVPQISLPSSLWQGVSLHTPSYGKGGLTLPNLHPPNVSNPFSLSRHKEA